MKVVFAARAEADLTEITVHIAEDDPAAAVAFVDRIIDEFTQEALMMHVDRKLNSTDLVDALTDLSVLHGPQAFIRSASSSRSSRSTALGSGHRHMLGKTAEMCPSFRTSSFPGRVSIRATNDKAQRWHRRWTVGAKKKGSAAALPPDLVYVPPWGGTIDLHVSQSGSSTTAT